MWQDVIKACPKQLAVELNSMSPSKRVNFILNAMNNSYIVEWNDVYVKLVDFIHDMWTDYNS